MHNLFFFGRVASYDANQLRRRARGAVPRPRAVIGVIASDDFGRSVPDHFCRARCLESRDSSFLTESRPGFT
jgi:hypothetical protein